MEPGRTVDKETQSGTTPLVFFYEFVGTAFLVLIYNSTRGLGVPGVPQPEYSTDPLILGLSMYVLVQLAWNVSGAHFNPAVSLAVYAAEGFKKETRKMFFVMVIAQILGAYLGVLIYFLGNQ